MQHKAGGKAGDQGGAPVGEHSARTEERQVRDQQNDRISPPTRGLEHPELRNPLWVRTPPECCRVTGRRHVFLRLLLLSHSFPLTVAIPLLHAGGVRTYSTRWKIRREGWPADIF